MIICIQNLEAILSKLVFINEKFLNFSVTLFTLYGGHHSLYFNFYVDMQSRTVILIGLL